MEKTNELNKFLSYIHMGTSIYRIYHDQAERLGDQKLLNKIIEIEEIFKTHEEKITHLINEFAEEATNSLTAAGIMGVYKEKLKTFDSVFTICINAVKSTNMGMVSAIKFLNENINLSPHVKEAIANVIIDYEKIQRTWVEYILEQFSNDNI